MDLAFPTRSRSCAPPPPRRLIPCRFAMLELSANDPLIKTYLKDLQHLKSQSATHELGLKGPFQTLLDKAAKRRGWTLVPELSTYSGGKRVVPDGTVRDEFRLARGWWEAKDTSDKLAAEIQKKLKAGYPARNTIFEDTQTAVLYTAIERAGANLSHFTEKQDFLNSVYEQFFQRFSPDVADTHGIVYTPRE